MKRINFTLDDETIALLGGLAGKFYGGNRSLAIRAAIESLAAHSGHGGWAIVGFTPVEIADRTKCHSCAAEFGPGATLFQPVFARSAAQNAQATLPKDLWLDCSTCAEGQL